MSRQSEVEKAICTLEDYAKQGDRLDLIATVTRRLAAIESCHPEQRDERKLAIILKAVDGDDGPPIATTRLEIPVGFIDPTHGYVDNSCALPNMTMQLQRALCRFDGEPPLGGAIQDVVQVITQIADRVQPEEKIVEEARNAREWFEGHISTVSINE